MDLSPLLDDGEKKNHTCVLTKKNRDMTYTKTFYIVKYDNQKNEVFKTQTLFPF